MFNFGIIAENFEVFENYIFDYKVLWMVGEGEQFCWFLRFVVIVEAEGAGSQMGRLPTAFICSEDVSGEGEWNSVGFFVLW